LNVRVFYHDRCFDGACSASLFMRFHSQCISPDAKYGYHGLVHRAGALFQESDFVGDENAIVDFKYSASPRITWWFDHHLSAFLTPADQRHFLAGQQDGSTSNREFYDPHYTSCTSFIAHIAQTRFGFDAAPVADLIHWADIVDGAPLLTQVSLGEVLEQPFVAELLPPLLERHHKSLAIIGERTELKDGTLYFDITDQPFEGYNKFVPYFLQPDATYSVGLSKSSFRTKVAVGSNPWTKAKPEQMINLAQICERYGGGGHARVGAISFPPDQGDRARAAAAEILSELRAHNPFP
jgi:hypothetical protein